MPALGVDFDGSADYLTRGGALTSAADSKVGILSCWLKLADTTCDILRNDAAGADPIVGLSYNSGSDLVQLTLQGTGPTTALLVTSAAGGFTITADTWFHLLISWDVGNSVSHLYIDDTDRLSESINSDLAIDYTTAADWGIGATVSGSNKLDGCLTEFYLNTADYLDFSVEANRRKFISADLVAVNLGADGSTPTGNQPIVYLRGPSARFATNLGYGGDFSVTGSLSECSDNP